MRNVRVDVVGKLGLTDKLSFPTNIFKYQREFNKRCGDINYLKAIVQRIQEYEV